MTNFMNCTPHAIVITKGATYAPSGVIPRVGTQFTDPVEGVCVQSFGDVTGLPDPVEGTLLIVSAMVLAASSRLDLVAPATGHKDTVRNDKGHIVSVPCFCRN